MTRALLAILVSGLALGALSGCLNWQESYNVAARADCMKLSDDSDRRACLNAVERNASEKRKEQRERNAG
jgi:hypothetical protein